MRLLQRVKLTRKNVSCCLADGGFRMGISETDAGLFVKIATFFWDSTAAEIDVMIQNFVKIGDLKKIYIVCGNFQLQELL